MMTIGLSVCTMMQLIRAANHPHTAPTLPVRPPLTRSHRYCSSLAISRTAASATRRDAVLLELATLVYPLSVQNAKADERDLEPTLRWKTYVGRDFIFQYPVSLFKESEELRQDGFGDGAAGRSQRSSPILVELLSNDSKITVVQSQATKLKQTFFQVTDISQLGTPEEVVRLLLPPSTNILSVKKVEYPQAARNTGTPIGILDRPPISIYRYEVILPNRQHAAVAIGAVLGRVILFGAAAPEEGWDKMGDVLSTVADSFKILPR